MLDQPRNIDNQRITSESLTSLSEFEMATIERYMKLFWDLKRDLFNLPV